MEPDGIGRGDPTRGSSAPDTREPVRLVVVDAAWADAYQRVANEIVAVLGDAMTSSQGRLLEVHHVGSTAVPGLLAKPTLDVMGRVARWPLDREAIGALARRGFHDHGEFGIPGRHFFTRGRHAVHLHLVAPEGELLRRHLAFRDYLADDASARAAYATRKRHLVATYAGERSAYVRGKAAWIRATTDRAVERLPERVGFGPVRVLRNRVGRASGVPGGVGSWAVGGGWALDLALGTPQRAHDDLDVVLDRATAEAWLTAVATGDVAFRFVSGGPIATWSPGDALPQGPCRIGARLGPAIGRSSAIGGANVETPAFWDLALELRAWDRWLLRTDPRVARPVRDAFVRYALDDGPAGLRVPALAPEVALLCKARLSGRAPGDAKDDGDFQATVSRLTPDARAWLARALARPPEHPWSARLRSTS